ncbi:hypothetical protein [Mycobacterium sp.]|uniref:hypothetical protein n=1 Tax=Mycobacterium sp. TaxID=1785 RepID=UPI002BFC1689|nr:hypothetical protein [Mycobacterium sp.]HKP42355.1 hypothetical protein [Mycobacterium sp.]
MSRVPNPAARLRGSAAGLLTAALAVAAHGIGGGAVPTGAASAQLVVLAAAIGALAATIARAADARVLLCLLAAGQLLGHVMLDAAGHAHTPSAAPPAAVMLAAHLTAIAAGAVLIAAGDRLCRAVSRAVQAAVRSICVPPAAPTVVAMRGADQPLRSALLLAASVSHRGPPVSLAH